MGSPTKVNLTDLIGNSRIGKFQVGVFLLCALCLLMDGFDVQAMGYTAPAVIKDWHIAGPSMAPVLSAALFGILVGSLLFSMLADRIGRRPVLIASAVIFSGFTLATSHVTDLNELLALRFCAGLGLGAIMPNVVALVGEYSPVRLKATLIMNVSNGFTTGAALGGFVAAWLIPNFGWRSVFSFGGVIPLLVAILMFFLLPESAQFLAVRGNKLDQVGRLARRIDPNTASGPNLEYVLSAEKKRSGVPLIHLFREGRGLGTILLWITNFMNLLNLYFLSSWLPTLVTGLGYTTRESVLVGTALQVGGTLGGVFLGWFVHRFGYVPTLATCFAVGCLNVALIGQPGFSLTILTSVVFLAGVGIVGGQAGINALAASYYPTDLRATGVGAGLGVGRVGAIVGPLVGGHFMRQHWSNQHLFLTAAVPAFISLLVILSFRWVIGPAREAAPRTAFVAQ